MGARRLSWPLTRVVGRENLADKERESRERIQEGEAAIEIES